MVGTSKKNINISPCVDVGTKVATFNRVGGEGRKVDLFSEPSKATKE